MTENKTSLNKKELHLEAEKQLLPRLKVMGFILIGFSLCAFLYALINESATIDYIEDELEEIQENYSFNSYLIGSSFVTVAMGCFFCVWKKKKSIHQEMKK